MEKKMFNRLNNQYYHIPKIKRDNDLYTDLIYRFWHIVNGLYDKKVIDIKDLYKFGFKSGLENALDYTMVLGDFQIKFIRCKCCGVHTKIVWNEKQTIENILFCIENTKVR